MKTLLHIAKAILIIAYAGTAITVTLSAIYLLITQTP